MSKESEKNTIENRKYLTNRKLINIYNLGRMPRKIIQINSTYTDNKT